MDKLFIVMPAYNEADNIEGVINQWYPVVEEINAEGNECSLVIANDGSKDNTHKILEECSKTRPYLKVLSKKNSGHGPTVIFLYKWAIEQGADYVFQTDSDGQTVPDDIRRMWNQRSQYDFQIGTRFGRKDGLVRVIVSRSLCFCIKLITGLKVKDANSPFRLMKSEPLAKVVSQTPEDFFLSNIAVATLAVRMGYKMAWIPVTFRPRQGGESMYNYKKIFKLGLQTYKDLKRL